MKDYSNYLTSLWIQQDNPKMYALHALCRLAVEAKSGKQGGWDYWQEYWTEKYHTASCSFL